jgi:hypothetical protein
VHIAGRHDDDVSVCPATRDFWAETKDARDAAGSVFVTRNVAPYKPYGKCNGMNGAALIPMLMNVGYR